MRQTGPSISPFNAWVLLKGLETLGVRVRAQTDTAARIAEVLASHPKISNNLGDAKSLVTHPATTTHQRLKPEDRAALGISEGFIRLSAGLEHPDDLIEDLTAALEKA